MEKFIERHANKIMGTVSCFDRVLFRGYLPIMSGAAMALYLKSQGVCRETVKAFVLDQAARLKAHALDDCTRTGRPYEYLSKVVRKEEMARKIAERDNIKQGLVCVLSVVEPCRTFSLAWNGRSARISDARRKCLHLYYYFIDPDLGLIHVKVQTWFPFRIQVYVNGHEWLARQLDRHRISYVKLDNAFLRVSDFEKAQHLADGFERVDWVRALDGYAIKVNPLLGPEEILRSMRYYWVTAQSEYSTDVLFRSRADLEELMPRQKLARTSFPLATEDDKRAGQVTRLLRRLHAHGLVAKIPRSRRWRVSLDGRRTMTTAIKLREVAYPSLFAAAA